MYYVMGFGYIHELLFFPCLKKYYDYGDVIFLLTFNLITVSSFRISNVSIGCAICLFMTLVVLTEIQTPKSCRALFKEPCVRLASEVAKVLKELATSIDDRRHCSPEILSDHSIRKHCRT
ncbi:Aluminum-activated malate transporter 12 [Linum grandiflorum]